MGNAVFVLNTFTVVIKKRKENANHQKEDLSQSLKR